ncbi:MAG: glycosyltransferase [Planctomycetota bacterium]
METEVKFSIVIPVLNESESINSIIKNLKDQGRGHEFEVIVVDGADIFLVRYGGNYRGNTVCHPCCPKGYKRRCWFGSK